MNPSRGHVAGLPQWDRCAVMGVVNVTPDSFSDGGQLVRHEAAVKHGLDLVAEGADLVDVGGESTRPGATRVDEAEELRRVVPVVRGLASEGVARLASTPCGPPSPSRPSRPARCWSTTSAAASPTPRMVPAVAAAGVPFVVMHWRGFSPST